jgi:hypothetical protein
MGVCGSSCSIWLFAHIHLISLPCVAKNRTEIYAEGGVALAMELLDSEQDDDTMIMRVVQLLSNMASKDSSLPRITDDLNCISPLYILLESSSNETLCEEILHCLQSIFQEAGRSGPHVNGFPSVSLECEVSQCVCVCVCVCVLLTFVHLLSRDALCLCGGTRLLLWFCWWWFLCVLCR